MASNYRWYIFSSLAIIVAFGVPSASFSQVTDAKMVEGWFLSKTKSVQIGLNSCTASKKFEDGTELRLDFSVNGSNRHKLELENEDWISLNSIPYGGEGKTDPIMPIKIEFEGTSAPAFEGDFRVVKKSRYNLKPRLWFAYDANQFGTMLINIAASRSLAVTSEARNIGTLPMTGSNAAIIALMQCAKSEMTEQNRRLENDPFKR